MSRSPGSTDLPPQAALAPNVKRLSCHGRSSHSAKGTSHVECVVRWTSQQAVDVSCVSFCTALKAKIQVALEKTLLRGTKCVVPLRTGVRLTPGAPSEVFLDHRRRLESCFKATPADAASAFYLGVCVCVCGQTLTTKRADAKSMLHLAHCFGWWGVRLGPWIRQGWSSGVATTTCRHSILRRAEWAYGANEHNSRH